MCRYQDLRKVSETAHLVELSILRWYKLVLCDPQTVLMVLSLVWRASSFPQVRLGSECHEPSWAMEKLQNLFPHSNQSFLIKFIKAFFKKYKCLTNFLRKNKSSQPPQRFDNFIFIVWSWAGPPELGFLKRPSPSLQFPGLPLH